MSKKRIKILSISTIVKENPKLLEAFAIMFEWANKQGLAGEKVGELLMTPDGEDFNWDPLDQRTHFSCLVEEED